MNVSLRPLSHPLGVELLGVDLGEEQPPAVRELARSALRDHHLVLVRGQAVHVEDQRRFASWFGAPATNEVFISNTRAEGVAREGSLLKHQDHCFLDELLPAICLYAEVVPSTGGDTIFVNSHLVYERMPPALTARVAGLHARHVYDYANDYGTQRFRVASSPQAPNAVHPVVLPHPVTSRPILFVNELMTDSIVELDPDAGEALLQDLFVLFDDPAVVYRHEWRVGDLVVWDNLSLQHGRTDFPAGQRRSLRRLPVGQRAVV